MANGGGANVSAVAEDKNWRDRIETELETARDWYKVWGFMGKSQGQATTGARIDTLEEDLVLHTARGKNKKLVRPSDSQYRTQLMDKVKRMELGEKTPDITPPESRQSSKHDVPDEMQKWYDSQKTPREKYPVPQTTSQQYGWSPTIELFGVRGNGRVRNPELMGAKTSASVM